MVARADEGVMKEAKQKTILSIILWASVRSICTMHLYHALDSRARWVGLEITKEVESADLVIVTLFLFINLSIALDKRRRKKVEVMKERREKENRAPTSEEKRM